MKSPYNCMLLVCAVALLLCSGCAGTPIQFPEYDGQVETEYDFTKGRLISAEASGFQLLLFIPIGTNTRHEKAYRRLKMIARDDYISDIKVKETWTYAFVGTLYSTRLEATVYPRKK